MAEEVKNVSWKERLMRVWEGILGRVNKERLGELADSAKKMASKETLENLKSSAKRMASKENIDSLKASANQMASKENLEHLSVSAKDLFSRDNLQRAKTKVLSLRTAEGRQVAWAWIKVNPVKVGLISCGLLCLVCPLVSKEKMSFETRSGRAKLVLGDKTLNKGDRSLVERMANAAPRRYAKKKDVADVAIAGALANMSEEDKKAMEHLVRERMDLPWKGLKAEKGMEPLKAFGLVLGMSRKEAEACLGKHLGGFYREEEHEFGHLSAYCLKTPVCGFLVANLDFAHDEKDANIGGDENGYFTGREIYEGLCFIRFEKESDSREGFDTLKTACEKELGFDLGPGNSRKDRYLVYFPERHSYVCLATENGIDSLTICAEDMAQDIADFKDRAAPPANAVRTVDAFEEIWYGFYSGERKKLYQVDFVPVDGEKYHIDRSSGEVSVKLALSVNDVAYNKWKKRAHELLSKVSCSKEKSAGSILVAGQLFYFGKEELLALSRWHKRQSIQSLIQPVSARVKCLGRSGKVLRSREIDLSFFERSHFFYKQPLGQWSNGICLLCALSPAFDSREPRRELLQKCEGSCALGRLKDMPLKVKDSTLPEELQKNMEFVSDIGEDENAYTSDTFVLPKEVQIDDVVDVVCEVVDFVDLLDDPED